MIWLFDLHRTQPIAHAIGVLAFVCVVGMHSLTTLLRILFEQVPVLFR